MASSYLRQMDTPLKTLLGVFVFALSCLLLGWMLYIKNNLSDFNIQVAYGHKVSSSVLPFDCDDVVVYEIKKIVAGCFLTNDYVYVHYFPSSVPNTGFSEQAILVLQFAGYQFSNYKDALKFVSFEGDTPDSFSMRLYDALGGDAYRGILEDTESNRSLIKSGRLRRMMQNPLKCRLPKQNAAKIAHDWVMGTSSVCIAKSFWRAERYSYGWKVLVFTGSEVGNHFLVTIGDDGAIKDYEGGR